MNPHKICSKCRTDKSLIYFHKDRGTKDGHAASCIVCRNAARKPKHFTTRKIEVEPEEKTAQIVSFVSEYKIIPSAINAQFQKVIDKYNCHFTLSVNKNLSCVLSTHGDPKRTWKAENPEQMITKITNTTERFITPQDSSKVAASE